MRESSGPARLELEVEVELPAPLAALWEVLNFLWDE